MLQEGVGNKDTELPVLLVLNKKDLIKPGEIAKKLEVRDVYKIEEMNFVHSSTFKRYLFPDNSLHSGIKNSLTLMMLYQ